MKDVTGWVILLPYRIVAWVVIAVLFIPLVIALIFSYTIIYIGGKLSSVIKTGIDGFEWKLK